jgi:hypothetical protein
LTLWLRRSQTESAVRVVARCTEAGETRL